MQRQFVRRGAKVLTGPFPELHLIEEKGRSAGLHIEDILDATVACWSALRLASNTGRSLPAVTPLDSTELPMAIWA